MNLKYFESFDALIEYVPESVGPVTNYFTILTFQFTNNLIRVFLIKNHSTESAVIINLFFCNQLCVAVLKCK